MSEETKKETTEEVLEENVLDSILSSVNATQQARVKDELKTYIDSIMKGETVSTSAVKAIDVEMAKIDELITAQLNEVMHHEKFQSLEATWRGLNYLVSNTNTGPLCKIKALCVSKEEMADDLANAAEFDQSTLFKRIYEEQYGTAGGDPFAAIVGDYYFDVSSNGDMDILEKMSGVAAASHAPFLSSVSPNAFGMDSFEQLADPRDLANKFDPKLNPDMMRWDAFRDWDDSRYIGLTMPRMLMRLPYGDKNPVGWFDFQEDVDGTDHSKYLWTNAAWGLASRMTDAYDKYSWCVNITGREGGGTVEGLPVHTFNTDSGDIAYKCPTEVAITDRRDAELDKLGFIPLVHYKDTNYSVFFQTHSAQRAKQYDDPDASANAELSVHLTYLMATCRFSHYMKAIMRDKLGTLAEGPEIESYLNKWFAQYTLADPSTAGVELKAKKPLSAFKVSVKEVEGKPGAYTVDLHLRPHYQLQEISMELHLVANISKPTN